MPLFSQRKGITPIEKPLQKESMDEPLRNQLWTVINETIWNRWDPYLFNTQTIENQEIERLTKVIWVGLLKEPTDTIPPFHSGSRNSAFRALRNYFFSQPWWGVYDFLEILLKNTQDDWSCDLKETANFVLEQENSAYRIIDSQIVEIEDDHEIEEIEDAIETTIDESREHLSRALELLSDRKNPDYRNSIKESVSAVEAVCKSITGDEKATLGGCLEKTNPENHIHPSLKEALKKLYGYTNDAAGIRHALKHEDIQVTFADAKLMLVTSSAFVNYLWTRASENGTKISGGPNV